MEEIGRSVKRGIDADDDLFFNPQPIDSMPCGCGRSCVPPEETDPSMSGGSHRRVRRRPGSSRASRWLARWYRFSRKRHTTGVRSWWRFARRSRESDPGRSSGPFRPNIRRSPKIRRCRSRPSHRGRGCRSLPAPRRPPSHHDHCRRDLRGWFPECRPPSGLASSRWEWRRRARGCHCLKSCGDSGLRGCGHPARSIRPGDRRRFSSPPSRYRPGRR